MNYPLITEYIESIKAAEDNFDQLKNLRPVLDNNGQPIMTGGNFAVVFKMKDVDTGKIHAVKCFLKEQEGRAEAYRQITEELENVSSAYLIPIKYLDKELFVDSGSSDENEFPVLLMDWVEGQTLDKYVREIIDDKDKLSMLAYRFCCLAMWLLQQPFAHGDLKPDNILVKEDGMLVLVDYDGMYVPAMKGQKARELGSPDFRHPARTDNDFNNHIDDFSIISILISIKAIAVKPELLEQYGAADRLLFSAQDYLDICQCQILREIFPSADSELNILHALFTLALEKGNLADVSFRLLILSRPETPELMKYVDLGLSVKWAECNLGAKRPEEFGDYFKWGDSTPKNRISNNESKKTGLLYNSKYNSSERKTILDPEDDSATILLGCPWRMPTIKEFKELKEKCEWSEEYLNGVKGCRVTGPNGNSIFLPFAGGYNFGCPYGGGYGVFWSSAAYIEHDLVFNNSWCLSMRSEHPSLDHYDRSCAWPIRPVLLEDDDLATEVTEEDLANSWTDEFGVMYSSDRRRLLKIKDYLWKKDEWHYSIYKGTKVICDDAFHPWKCSYRNCGTSSIEIPDSVIIIGRSAFMGIGLSSIFIPKSVKEIGYCALADNPYLDSIEVDDGNPVYDSRNNCNAIIRTHSNELIIGCKSTIIPSGVIKICHEAFSGCYNLSSINIPNGVKTIGEKAFSYCDRLRYVNLPQSVTTIEDYAFEGCSLQYIILGENIESVGKGIFESFRFKRVYASVDTQNRIKKVTSEYDKYFDETQSTNYDFIDAWTDEYGAKYSADRKRLLKVPRELKNYSIKEGTVAICNEAFGDIFTALRRYTSKKDNNELIGIETVTIPRTVQLIGKQALFGCPLLKYIYIPLGAKSKFEVLLADYADKLVEQEDGENLNTEKR